MSKRKSQSATFGTGSMSYEAALHLATSERDAIVVFNIGREEFCIVRKTYLNELLALRGSGVAD